VLLFELMSLQRNVGEDRDHQRRRISARRLRAEMRERERAERLIMELPWSRLC